MRSTFWPSLVFPVYTNMPTQINLIFKSFARSSILYIPHRETDSLIKPEIVSAWGSVCSTEPGLTGRITGKKQSTSDQVKVHRSGVINESGVISGLATHHGHSATKAVNCRDRSKSLDKTKSGKVKDL